LLYLTGGLAIADISHHSVDDYLSLNEPLWDKSSKKMGYSVGGGIEYAINSNWSIKAEGLYMDFGKMTIAGSTADNNEAEGYNVSIKTNAKIIRTGLNYAF
jgi:outer membrane immunogenic protein